MVVAEIGCERGHATHEALWIEVALGGPTVYHDYPPVPERLARRFGMWVFDWRSYHREPGPYCPASGIHSQAIAETGIWEPPETVMALMVMDSAPVGSRVVDMGCAVGWYSLLAASYGMDVLAWDGDAEALRLLRRSAEDNGWDIRTRGDRITPATEPMAPAPCRLAKLDLEGAELDGVRVLWPSIRAGLVDHILIEVSPVFAGYYPGLVRALVTAGYRAYLIPDKRTPPYPLEDPGRDLTPLCKPGVLNEWEQRSVWLRREGALW